MASKCIQREILARSVAAVLDNLAKLTKAQLEAFRKNDKAEYMRIDKELETAISMKERSIGALHEHEREHGCG